MRDVFNEPHLVHMWTDSSPQGGHDWLLSHMHYVVDGSASGPLRLAVAVDALALRPAAWDQVADAPAVDMEPERQ
eukprot:11160781-Lingulodinium_polyedra.AAC.1